MLCSSRFPRSADLACVIVKLEEIIHSNLKANAQDKFNILRLKFVLILELLAFLQIYCNMQRQSIPVSFFKQFSMDVHLGFRVVVSRDVCCVCWACNKQSGSVEVWQLF